MGQIPEDAIHWDSGDWIAWHRSVEGIDDRPCGAATEDSVARIAALHVSLLRAAKSYFQMTGKHLPVYPFIAESYAAMHFDLPLVRNEQSENRKREIKLMHIPPHGPGNTVEVDLSNTFGLLVVVRIKDNFSVEARMIKRSALPRRSSGTHEVNWQSLPRRS